MANDVIDGKRAAHGAAERWLVNHSYIVMASDGGATRPRKTRGVVETPLHQATRIYTLGGVAGAQTRRLFHLRNDRRSMVNADLNATCLPPNPGRDQSLDERR